MRTQDIAELVALASLWGASFLFMRLGAADFGPAALAAVRVAGASLFLLPLVWRRGQLAALRAHARPIFIVGLFNSALPFLCYAYAALSITAGLASVFNAATPLFGAAIGWLWLGDRLTRWRVLGLAIGFAGVSFLAWSQAQAGGNGFFKPGGSGWAVAACLAATLCYGLAANYTKKALTGVPPLALAAGSQIAAAVVLLLPALWWWPAVPPRAGAWAAAAALAVVSTGIAYVLYFRLIGRIGPAKAVSVTFLIPVFAVAWGALFLAERVDGVMALGCAIVLAGTALALGLWPRPRAAGVAPGAVRPPAR